jgi:hypothetical protein
MSLPVFLRVAGDLSVGPDAIIVECTAGEAITAGQTVMDDVAITDIALVGKQVKIGGAAGRIRGIALNTAASGGIVRVLKKGYTTGILTDGSVVVADPQLFPAAAGAVRTVDTSIDAGSDIEIVGFAMADDSSTTSGLVFINCP